MNTTSDPVALRLLDREFHIACAPEERGGLLEAALYLDRKMRELKANARTPGFDRIAVLAAISITHELLQVQKQGQQGSPELTEDLALLRRKLEQALAVHVK
ncbi:cell division protein ZapA [Frateuria aurantia]